MAKSDIIHETKIVPSRSEKGISWSLVGDSIRDNNTVENLARLFAAAKDQDYGVFISPHYLYPHDQAWQYGGIVEHMMLDGKEFFRPDFLGRDGFSGSGADWLERYKTPPKLSGR